MAEQGPQTTSIMMLRACHESLSVSFAQNFRMLSQRAREGPPIWTATLDCWYLFLPAQHRMSKKLCSSRIPCRNPEIVKDPHMSALNAAELRCSWQAVAGDFHRPQFDWRLRRFTQATLVHIQQNDVARADSSGHICEG